MERADVVVVGLGAMGSAAARSLGRRGVGTVALDQFSVGHTRGASHGPTRIFRLSYPDPAYVGMAQRALPLWRELEREAGQELLLSTGGLDAGPLAEQCAQALATQGVTHEWLDPAEALARFPGVSTDGLDGVLFQPDAGVSLAERAVAAQVRLAESSGVDVRENVAVVGLRPHDDGVAVDTSFGPIEARVAVVTPGAWARSVLPEVPVTAAAQTVGYFEPVDVDAVWPTFIEWDNEGFAWYEVPSAGGAPGVKVAEHRPGPHVDPADGPFDPDHAAVVATESYVRRRFPGLKPEARGSDVCLYELTPDEDFVLDRSGPLVVGAGGSGHGFKFTPLIGEVLADLATGKDPGVPAGRFSLTRF